MNKFNNLMLYINDARIDISKSLCKKIIYYVIMVKNIQNKLKIEKQWKNEIIYEINKLGR